jgi:hypothetical protein
MSESQFSTLLQVPGAPRIPRRRTTQAGNRQNLLTNILDPSSFALFFFPSTLSTSYSSVLLLFKLARSRSLTIHSSLPLFSSSLLFLSLLFLSLFLLTHTLSSSSLPLAFLLRRTELRKSIQSNIFISQRCLARRRISPFIPPSQQPLP